MTAAARTRRERTNYMAATCSILTSSILFRLTIKFCIQYQASRRSTLTGMIVKPSAHVVGINAHPSLRVPIQHASAFLVGLEAITFASNAPSCHGMVLLAEKLHPLNAAGCRCPFERLFTVILATPLGHLWYFWCPKE